MGLVKSVAVGGLVNCLCKWMGLSGVSVSGRDWSSVSMGADGIGQQCV